MILIRLLNESRELAHKIERKFTGGRCKKPNVISRWPSIYDKVSMAVIAKKQ